jgi:hypothetical protein
LDAADPTSLEYIQARKADVEAVATQKLLEAEQAFYDAVFEETKGFEV